jgi:hypothetical protein
MKIIIDFLSSPIWQGIQGLLAIIALIVSLTNPRKLLLERPNTKWIVKTPWTWILIVGGLLTGLSIGIKYQNLYLGLFTTFAISTIALGIQWLQNHLLLSRFNQAYDQLTYQYYELIKIIGRLQKTKYTLNNWKISHTIYENGDSKLREEITIVPVNEPVIYYFVEYKVDMNPGKIKITTENISNTEPVPLSVFEVENSNQSKTYMIVLDPPSTSVKPQRISIICERAGFWRRLIEHGQDDGTILTPFKVDIINFEIFAPRDTKWRILDSQFGEKKIEMFGAFSRATWEIKNPDQEQYHYKLFLQKEDKKVS